MTAYQLGSSLDPPADIVDPFFTVPSALFLLKELTKTQRKVLEMDTRIHSLEKLGGGDTQKRKKHHGSSYNDKKPIQSENNGVSDTVAVEPRSEKR